MEFGCWMSSPCPPNCTGMLAIMDIHGYRSDIQISIGNLEMQSYTVESLNNVSYFQILVDI